MKALAYYMALPIIYVVAMLPLPLLYLVSDFFFFIIYYIVGYRKKVVVNNLKSAFPEKSDNEIKNLSKKFFAYFCDLVLESFKTLTFTKKQALQAFEFDKETEKLINDYADKNQNLIFVIGHQGNWEWSGNSLAQIYKGKLYVIYHRLSNKYFDKLMYKMRTRFGSGLIEMNDVPKSMLRNKNHVNATGFIADQTPSPQNAYWVWFLQQPTPVFKGTEILAKKFNYPVIYFTIKRIKRGKYFCSGKLLCAEPKNTNNGEITLMHTRMLEKDIHNQPEIWLWSHKRWKHKPSNEVLELLKKQQVVF